MLNHAEAEGELVCAGIWGGIRDMDRELRAGGITASLYSSSSDGGKGGDIYYIGVCSGDMLTRVAIADVMGHGQAVSDVSGYVYDSLKTRICDPDSGRILSELNQVARRQGLKAMTTAAVVAYHAESGELSVSYAGHPPFLLRRANERTWSVAEPDDEDDQRDAPPTDLPLAVIPDAAYRRQVIPVASGDRLFVYTDGVTEAPDPDGNLFGTKRLRRVLEANGDAPLPQLKSALLDALHRHTGNGLTHDDVTLIAIEVR
jgi:sigma-B regulation protein RsbU (phosphoserine phosphatase)